MSATLPDKVYRYRRIDVMTIELLCHDQLYFADPTQFNDPFDCDPTVISDSAVDALRVILAELIKRRIAAETLAALSDMIRTPPDFCASATGAVRPSDNAHAVANLPRFCFIAVTSPGWSHPFSSSGSDGTHLARRYRRTWRCWRQ